MAEKTINIQCGQCGHMLKVKQPAAPGVYQVNCPKCQNTVKIQLRAKPIRLEGTQEAPAQSTGNQKKVKLLTDIKAWKEGTFAVRPAVPINTPYAFHCPKCGKTVLFSLPKAGVSGVKCKRCSTLTFAKGFDKKESGNKPTKPGNRNKRTSPGELSWGNIFRRKRHALREGVTVIGRKDLDRPSNIMFKDPEMSRQSVVIEVAKKENGYFFKLTVKNALNPVLHNNKPLAVSESVYLNYGDSLQLGNTVINFNEKKK